MLHAKPSSLVISAVLFGVAVLVCAAAPADPQSVSTLDQVGTAPHRTSVAADGLTLAESPDDFGACYTWLRVTPWREMCNEVDRETCDLSNTITLGRRFEAGGTCPEGT